MMALCSGSTKSVEKRGGEVKRARGIGNPNIRDLCPTWRRDGCDPDLGGVVAPQHALHKGALRPEHLCQAARGCSLRSSEGDPF